MAPRACEDDALQGFICAGMKYGGGRRGRKTREETGRGLSCGSVLKYGKRLKPTS